MRAGLRTRSSSRQRGTRRSRARAAGSYRRPAEPEPDALRRSAPLPGIQTWHNLNVVPTNKGYVLVAGNYQSGISVVDFTDPANASEIAFADPAPLVDPNPPVGIELGGDWSSYWYNGRIYESDISRGLIIWKLSDNAVAGARKLGHLNPQTQEFTFDLK